MSLGCYFADLGTGNGTFRVVIKNKIGDWRHELEDVFQKLEPKDSKTVRPAWLPELKGLFVFVKKQQKRQN